MLFNGFFMWSLLVGMQIFVWAYWGCEAGMSVKTDTAARDKVHIWMRGVGLAFCAALRFWSEVVRRKMLRSASTPLISTDKKINTASKRIRYLFWWR